MSPLVLRPSSTSSELKLASLLVAATPHMHCIYNRMPILFSTLRTVCNAKKLRVKAGNMLHKNSCRCEFG